MLFYVLKISPESSSMEVAVKEETGGSWTLELNVAFMCKSKLKS
jgi:hypothetical protein